MMLSSLVRMESSVWRILRRSSRSVALAVSAISSGERMDSVICRSSTGWGLRAKNKSSTGSTSWSETPYHLLNPSKLRRVAATSSSSPIERMPPLTAWAAMRRASDTAPKRGLPFLISSELTASVWARAHRSSSGVWQGWMACIISFVSRQAHSSVARAMILSSSNVVRYEISINFVYSMAKGSRSGRAGALTAPPVFLRNPGFSAPGPGGPADTAR